MIITLEEHELFEEAILSRGFTKGRAAISGSLSFYLLNKNSVVAYNREKENEFKQIIYLVTPEGVQETKCKDPWIDQLLKEKEKPKTYRIKEYGIRNRKIEGRILALELDSARVLTAVEGLDHASDIFDELDTEKRAQTENALVLAFIERISQEQMR